MADSEMEHLSGILFDLDGVLYNADQRIAGAAEAIAWIHSSGIPHLFVTNTTSQPRSVLANKLAAFGFASASEDQILTPAVAAAAWLKEQGAGKVALFVRDAARVEFAGLSTVPDDAETGADFVVIGDLGQLWDYRTLNRAFRLLHHNPDAKLIALGMTRYWHSGDGVSLDVAPFVAALESASGCKSIVMGKPAQQFFHAATGKLGLTASQVLMVGDDVVTDVGGAQDAGLKGILVRTGKFRPADLQGPVKPLAVIDSIADLPDLWSSLRT